MKDEDFPLIVSAEATYYSTVYQAFFEDEDEEYEVVIRVGYATGGGGDHDVTVEWQGEGPEWADTVTDLELYQYVYKWV